MSQHQEAGSKLVLYDGSQVRVTAAPLFAGDDVGPRILAWFEELAAAGPVDPAATFDSTKLPVSRPTLVAWILAASDPDRGLDLAWCRAHLHTPDFEPIITAWIHENNFTPVLVALRRAAEGLGDLVKVLAWARASAQATAGPGPGEMVS